MKPTPVDIVLHSLADDLRELSDDRLRDLANAITTHCIDPRVVADQWTDGAGVGQHAAWLLRRLDPNDSGLRPAWAKVSAETRAMEVAVARRLADAGLALLVTQDDDDRTAGEALLEASHLVVGLPRAQEAQYSGLANEARLAVDHITTWSRTSDHPYVGTRLSVAVVDLTKRIDALRASEREKALRTSPTTLCAPPMTPTPPKFKVGDRVRFARREGKNTTEDSAPPPLGWEGEIVMIAGDEIPYLVSGKPWSIDPEDKEHWFPATALDLVTPA